MSRKSSKRKHHKKGPQTGSADSSNTPAASRVKTGERKSTTWEFFVIFFVVLLAVGWGFASLYRDHEKQRAPITAKEGDTDENTAKSPLLKRQPEPAPTPPPTRTPEPPASQPAVSSPEIAIEKPADPPEPGAIAPDEAEIANQVDALHPMPSIRPLMEIVGKWKNVPKSAFPRMITIKIPLTFEVTRDGAVVGRSKLPSGSSVVPLDLVDGVLTVSSSRAAPVAATVDIDQTDFKARIQARYEVYVKRRTELVIARRAAERNRLLQAVALEETLSSYNKGEDSRFDPLKDSLRRGDAGFFELDSVSKWRWGGKELVAGVEYDTAFVIMASESAFGITEREIKALVQGGKVVKWIDVASGEEL